jgi:hypothetical protein
MAKELTLGIQLWKFMMESGSEESGMELEYGRINKVIAT